MSPCVFEAAVRYISEFLVMKGLIIVLSISLAVITAVPADEEASV